MTLTHALTDPKGTSMTLASTTPSPAPVLSDEQQYRILFVATFAIFLVAVSIKRVARSLAGKPAGSLRSIFAEARDTGTSALLFAFMG